MSRPTRARREPAASTSDAWRRVDGAGAERPKGRRREVLELLRASATPLGVAQIATSLDVHPNTVRFHLDVLVDTGLAERVEMRPVGPGRPALVFQARPGMDPAGPRSYRLLAAIMASSLAATPDPAARAVELGRRWGGGLVDQAGSEATPSPNTATDRLTGLLDDLGFSPERRSAGGHHQIGLRHCPFLELADTQAEVICPLHLGLMQGAMEELGSSITVESLEPFAEPDLCLVHLSGPTESA